MNTLQWLEDAIYVEDTTDPLYLTQLCAIHEINGYLVACDTRRMHLTRERVDVPESLLFPADVDSRAWKQVAGLMRQYAKADIGTVMIFNSRASIERMLTPAYISLVSIAGEYFDWNYFIEAVPENATQFMVEVLRGKDTIRISYDDRVVYLKPVKPLYDDEEIKAIALSPQKCDLLERYFALRVEREKHMRIRYDGEPVFTPEAKRFHDQMYEARCEIDSWFEGAF